tara:strand:+ start:410 stop:577 length:168 start_codon:yes stop_codon:yes gene_type:complete
MFDNDIVRSAVLKATSVTLGMCGILFLALAPLYLIAQKNSQALETRPPLPERLYR